MDNGSGAADSLRAIVAPGSRRVKVLSSDRRGRGRIRAAGVERTRMGSLLSSLAIASLFGVGAGALLAPMLLAQNYGLALEEGDDAGRGFVRALGARDATIGAIALAFALRGERAAVRRTLGITTLLAMADFTIVARARGVDAWPSLVIHGSGIAGLLLAAAVE